MILSFELPFALVPLLKFTSSKTKMGTHANSITISAITWVIGSLIMGINIYYLAEKLVTSLRSSHLKLVGVVFCGILGFSGMIVYLAGILYLVFRNNTEGGFLLPLRGPENLEMASESGSATVPNLPREDIADMQLPQGRTTSDLD